MTVHVREGRAGPVASPVSGDAQRSLTVNAEMVRRVLPEFDQVSLMVADEDGAFHTCAQSGGLARDLDRLQHDLAEGPCIDSLRDKESVIAPYLGRDERWRRYASSVTDLGVRSQVTTPLVWREGNLLGALNMYSTSREDVALAVPVVAKAFAVQIAGTLASFREIEHLHRALDTRKTIGVAMGLLMAEYDLNESAAFAVLRRRSSYANMKLRDIAAQMVAEVEGAGRELPPAATC